MAFLPDEERKRAVEFLRRYNCNAPADELVLFMASVYSESRQTERAECIKCVSEVQANALKAQRLEVGKSQSGMDFQSGRRKGAEDAISKIAARSALQLSEDSKPTDYIEGVLTNVRV